MTNNLVRENNGNATSRREGEKFILPPASVSEIAEGYLLELEMPGVNKDGLEISIENNELSILGRRSNSGGRRDCDSSRIPSPQLSAFV